jgi:hypothetical protein
VKPVKKLVVLSLLAVLAACGGGGGGRPSTDDLAKALNDHGNKVAAQFTGAFSDAGSGTIDCIAKVLHDSKVSDGSLKAIVDGNEDYHGSHADSQALQDATTGMAKCINP